MPTATKSKGPWRDLFYTPFFHSHVSELHQRLHLPSAPETGGQQTKPFPTIINCYQMRITMYISPVKLSIIIYMMIS